MAQHQCHKARPCCSSWKQHNDKASNALQDAEEEVPRTPEAPAWREQTPQLQPLYVNGARTEHGAQQRHDQSHAIEHAQQEQHVQHAQHGHQAQHNHQAQHSYAVRHAKQDQHGQVAHHAASMDYDALPKPSLYPLEGDIIAYCLLHIGSDWTPQVILLVLLNCIPTRGTLLVYCDVITLKPCPCLAPQGGGNPSGLHNRKCMCLSSSSGERSAAWHLYGKLRGAQLMDK